MVSLRWMASVCLGASALSAQQTTTELIVALGNPVQREAAIEALVAREAVTEVVKVLPNTSDRQRRALIDVLWRLPQDREQSLSALLDLAENLDPVGAIPCAEAIANLTGYSIEQMQRVYNLASDFRRAASTIAEEGEHYEQLQWASHELMAGMRLGQDASLDDLVAVISRNITFLYRARISHRYAREESAARSMLAAKRIGRSGASAIPQLRELARALGRLRKPRRNDVAPAVRRRVCDAVADAILAIDPNSPHSVLAYAYKAASADPPQRLELVRRLALFGAEGAAAVPDLVKMLANEDAPVAREAATTLGLIGPAAVEAIPELERLVDGEDKQMQVRAKAALRQIRG